MFQGVVTGMPIPHYFDVILFHFNSLYLLLGALGSAGSIAETAGKGLSFLSGDAEFARQRAIQRQKVLSAPGGIVKGLVSGTDNIIHGIKSGVSGLVMKPIEEAQSDGVAGFFRGMGLGVLGVAVKPVLGLADGISTIAKVFCLLDHNISPFIIHIFHFSFFHDIFISS